MLGLFDLCFKTSGGGTGIGIPQCVNPGSVLGSIICKLTLVSVASI